MLAMARPEQLADVPHLQRNVLLAGLPAVTGKAPGCLTGEISDMLQHCVAASYDSFCSRDYYSPVLRVVNSDMKLV